MKAAWLVRRLSQEEYKPDLPSRRRGSSVKKLAYLYPGYASEEDYPLMATSVDPRVENGVFHTEVPVDAHRPDALRRVGAIELLLEPMEEVRAFAPDALSWACTSGSFIFGPEGASRQIDRIQEAYGIPSSSTSLAFLRALRHLGVERVAVRATYPEDVAGLFGDFVEQVGVSVESVECLDIITGVEVGALQPERIIDFVASSAPPGVEAILVPDTAMATASFLDDLEKATGTVVLTANQVTMWDLLRIAGWEGVYPSGGALFRGRG